MLHALIDVEAAEAIGADGYQRAESRRTWRNGSCERLLTTKAGDVELRIPKLRKGTFFPSLLERRRPTNPRSHYTEPRAGPADVCMIQSPDLSDFR